MADRLYWYWCALCFHVGMRMPEPIWFRLLPWIGTYAHCEDFAHFVELKRLTAIEPKDGGAG